MALVWLYRSILNIPTFHAAARFEFTLERYSVLETVGVAPVAVTLTSGLLERWVDVVVETHDFEAIGMCD